MTYKQYLFWMIFITGLSWFGWVSILRKINPMSSGLFGGIFFYSTLSLALVGSLAIIGLVFRVMFRKREAITRHVSTSFRQSLLLSSLVIGSLMLHSRSVLNWSTLLMFIGVLTITEFFLISYKSTR